LGCSPGGGEESAEKEGHSSSDGEKEREREGEERLNARNEGNEGGGMEGCKRKRKKW